MTSDLRLTAGHDALTTAQREVVAAIACDLSLIDKHGIDVRMFPSAPHRVAFILLTTFHKQFPNEPQAPFSRLAWFVREVPELGGLFSDNTLTVEELPAMLDSGWYTVNYIAGNISTLRAAGFELERREKLAELETLPLHRFVDEASEWITRLKHSAAAPDYKIVTARELATNDYPLNYMIPGLLVEGQPAVIGGGKKSLKTTLLIDLALSLASQSRFLGEFVVSRRYRVGLMSGESGAATIKETAERIAKSKPWFNLSDYTGLIFSFDLPKLGKPDTAANLVQLIKAHALEVLCIDPLYLAMQAGDGASNLYSMGDKLAPLTEVIAETGCTIILAHHARKIAKSDFNRFAPPELDDLAFAGISEWARQWLLINRREEYDPENGGHHELWFASGGSAGHSGLWALSIDEGTRQTPGGRHWSVSVSKASETRKAAIELRETAKAAKEQERQQRDEQKLLETYRKFPRGETASVLAEAAGMNAARFRAANSRLLTTDRVIACRLKKGKKSHDGFRLKTAESDESDKSDKNNSCPTRLCEGVSQTDDSLPLGESPSESISLYGMDGIESSNSANAIRRTPPEDDRTNQSPNGKRKSRKKSAKPRKASA